MANTRLSAFFSLLLVFLSGIVVGAAGYRVYNAPPHFPTPDERRQQLIAETTREVHLTPDQVQKLEKIYDETGERFAEIHDSAQKEMHEKAQALRDDQIAQIKAFLSPEQIVLYDKLREKRRLEREAMDKKKGHFKGEIKKDR